MNDLEAFEEGQVAEVGIVGLDHDVVRHLPHGLQRRQPVHRHPRDSHVWIAAAQCCKDFESLQS